MSRLSRFEDYRFLGAKDTMLVYDCDDDSQFTMLQERVQEEDLISRNMVQSFAPDTLIEAVNRSFSPVMSQETD